MPGFTEIIGAVLIAGNAALWVWLWGRRNRRGTIVDCEPRRNVPWTGIDLVKIALVVLVAGQLVRVSFDLAGASDGGPLDDPQADAARMPKLLLATATLNLLTMAAAVAALRCFRSADWRDLGCDTSRLRGDVCLGLAAFAAVSVPVYALQYVLVQLVPSEHPLIKTFQSVAKPGWGLWASSIFAVVLVAPLVEEFLFRVLLQGWLESLVRSGDSDEMDERHLAPAAVYSIPPSRYWQPIVFSSAVFALMHSSHGPDVVPLFFFALALGYLYQQTHRLWPSVVVHFSLNACTLARLAWG
ncbi:MAG TPA: CPBP family intramembrane glutamic endopeptidase [Pirellulales bacterium]|nr:CPBP family intramembrane glutamic endopeptidase [Pirellulales bacterium]